MQSDFDNRLEQEIGRELKALPEITAPVTLAGRVLARIGLTSIPWYRRSWQAWPPVWQTVSFALLLAAFAGFCFAMWELAQGSYATAAFAQAQECFYRASVMWNTLTVLGGTAVLMVKNLSTGFLIASAAIALISYLLCIGLGTAVVRLASARR